MNSIEKFDNKIEALMLTLLGLHETVTLKCSGRDYHFAVFTEELWFFDYTTGIGAFWVIEDWRKCLDEYHSGLIEEYDWFLDKGRY